MDKRDSLTVVIRHRLTHQMINNLGDIIPPGIIIIQSISDLVLA